MTGAKTTIVYLCKHLKESRSPCQMFCPSAKYVWGKKHFFWLKLKFLCLNCRQYVKDLTKNRAKSMFAHVATRVQCRHFGSVSAVKKLAGLRNIVCLSVARATLAPDFRFLKNSLLRLREKFSKQIWRPRRKQRSNNRNNLTTQPLGQKYCPERPING